MRARFFGLSYRSGFSRPRRRPALGTTSATDRTSAVGHEDPFPPRRLNARCPFSEGTFRWDERQRARRADPRLSHFTWKEKVRPIPTFGVGSKRSATCYDSILPVSKRVKQFTIALGCELRSELIYSLRLRKEHTFVATNGHNCIRFCGLSSESDLTKPPTGIFECSQARPRQRPRQRRVGRRLRPRSESHSSPRRAGPGRSP
jgi:hypothetical protein